jgi:hypothetical protein
MRLPKSIALFCVVLPLFPLMAKAQTFKFSLWDLSLQPRLTHRAQLPAPSVAAIAPASMVPRPGVTVSV